MPAPLFMLGLKAAQAIGKSPVFKAAITGAKSAAAGALGNQRTTISTSGSTTSINAQGQAAQTPNNLLLLVGGGLALFFLMKK